MDKRHSSVTKDESESLRKENEELSNRNEVLLAQLEHYKSVYEQAESIKQDD